jgi:ABC-type uncharacterized transport system permease subunit
MPVMGFVCGPAFDPRPEVPNQGHRPGKTATLLKHRATFSAGSCSGAAGCCLLCSLPQDFPRGADGGSSFLGAAMVHSREQ